MKKIVYSTFIFFMFFFYSTAQEVSIEQTIQYINTKLGGSNTIDVVHGELIATFLENGQPYREDQVAIQDLDTTAIKYLADQGMFVVNCKGTQKKCVTRNLFVHRETKTYGRLSFPVNLNTSSVNGMKNAFLHLVRLLMIRKYSSTESFE